MNGQAAGSFGFTDLLESAFCPFAICPPLASLLQAVSFDTTFVHAQATSVNSGIFRQPIY
jgi:hypothetical protein